MFTLFRSYEHGHEFFQVGGWDFTVELKALVKHSIETVPTYE